jgi:hypothetical protein
MADVPHLGARAMSSDDVSLARDGGDARASDRPTGSVHRKRTESRYLSAEADVFAHLAPTDVSSTSGENVGEPSPSGYGRAIASERARWFGMGTRARGGGRVGRGGTFARGTFARARGSIMRAVTVDEDACEVEKRLTM